MRGSELVIMAHNMSDSGDISSDTENGCIDEKLTLLLKSHKTINKNISLLMKDYVTRQEKDNIEKDHGYCLTNNNPSTSHNEKNTNDTNVNEKTARSREKSQQKEKNTIDTNMNENTARSRETSQQKEAQKKRGNENNDNNNAESIKKTCNELAQKNKGNEKLTQSDSESSDFPISDDEKIKYPELDEDLESDSEDIYQTILQGIEDETKQGPKIHKDLEKIVNKRFEARMPPEKLKERLDKLIFPSDVSILPPSLNKEVVEKANLSNFHPARRNDNRIMSTQRVISSATAALIQASETLHDTIYNDNSTSSARRSCKKALSDLSTSVAFLGAAQQDLSSLRKHQISNALPNHFRSICYRDNTMVTDQLFGNCVEESIKQASITFKQRSRARGNPNRFSPYSRPFLSRGRGRGQGSSQDSSQVSQRGNFNFRSNRRRRGRML